jgi:hypothetical protein
MSFLGGKMAEAPKIELIGEGFPPPTLATIYCDGILNAAPSAHIVRFYLYRQDPDQVAKPKHKNQIVAQIIMPVDGFISSSLFFESALKKFVEQGTISQQMVDKIKQTTQTEQSSNW